MTQQKAPGAPRVPAPKKASSKPAKQRVTVAGLAAKRAELRQQLAEVEAEIKARAGETDEK